MFPTTNSNLKEDAAYPIVTIMVTDAEMASLKATYLGNSDLKPYVVCNIQDPSAKIYFMWNGADWINMQIQVGVVSAEKIISIDFSFNGIYAHSNPTFQSIPIQVMIAKLLAIGVFTKVEAKIVMSYATTGVATAEAELYNYTDSVPIAGTNLLLPSGTWIYAESNWVDITPFEGKAVRLRTKKIGGFGQIQTEGTQILLKYS